MIDTIFFTLAIRCGRCQDKAFSDAAEQEMMRLVGTTESHDAFFCQEQRAWDKYRKARKTGTSTPPKWSLSQHLCGLPDRFDLRCSGKLTRLWRDHDGRARGAGRT
jgi:hypothetical protein